MGTVLLAGLSAVCSALSWVSAVKFYRQFGVSPVSAGVTWPDLVFPSVVLIVVIGGALAGGVFLGRVVRDWELKCRRKRWGARIGACVATVVALTVAAAVLPWATTAVLLTPSAVVPLAGFAEGVADRKQARPSHRLGLGVTVAAFLALFVGFWAILGAPVAADRFVAGRNGAVSATPFVLRLGPTVKFVRLFPVASSTELAWLAKVPCALHLGDGPEGRVLVVPDPDDGHGAVIFVNSQLVSIEAAGRCPLSLPDGTTMAP